nr:hypothetical protein [Tanacetum cinerariifolium]
MAAKVPQTLEYRGGQLNAALVLEVENFTNWKKRFMYHINGIEPKFKNIIENGHFIPMTLVKECQKDNGQEMRERTFKIVPMMKRIREVVKSTWMTLKKSIKPRSFSQDFQDSPDDEEDTRSSQEYMDDLEEEYFISKFIYGQNKGLIAEAYEWDEKDVLFDDNEMTKVKVLMALVDDENVVAGKESVKRLWLSEAEGFTLTNNDTGRILLADFSTPLPLLEKLAGTEPIYGPKTIKSILKSKSTFKVETLKRVTINEPSSTPVKVNKDVSTSKLNSAPAGQGGYSSRSKTPRPSKHFFPPCIHYGFSDHLSDDCKNYPICNIRRSYDHDTYGHNMIISLRRRIKPRNPQHVIKSCETCGSIVHTTTDHNDIEWFRRGEALQAKEVEALKSNKINSIHANRSKTPTKRSTIVKRHLKTPYEIFPRRIPNIDFLHVFGCPVYIHNHKDYLGKFDEKADDVDNINIAESERYPPDEYLYPYEPSQRHKKNSNDVSFIEPYERPEPVVLKSVKRLWLSEAEGFTLTNNDTGRILLAESQIKVIDLSYDHDTYGHNMIISLRRRIKPRNPQHVIKSCETCGSIVHTTTDHNDIEWFRRGEALQAKEVEALKSNKINSIHANRSKTPTKRSTIVKRHLKTPYEIFPRRIPNIDFLHVFGCPVYIHNHKDYLGKFDEKADDVDNINIAESERYPPDEYLYPYEPSQRHKKNSNDVSFIEPYERPEPVVLKRIKCSKIFPLSVMNSHCQKKFPLLEEVPTARVILPLISTSGVASKDLDNLIESQSSDKNKDGLGYSAVPLPAQLYLSPKKDLSWTGLPECADDTVTDYSRPSPTVESTSGDDQNRNSSASENGESTDSILSKLAIKKSSKKSTVRGNQRNWNNLKSQQLEVKKGTTRPQNNTHKSMPPRPAIHRPYRPPMRPIRPNMNAAQPKKTSFYKPAHSYNKRPFHETTQDLMIILIQRVQRLERELKARTPKVDRGRSRSAMAWVPKKKLDCRCNIKFRGGLLGIKCSKIFLLSVMNFHCQKKFPLLEEVPTARVILPLVCTAGEDYSQSKMH